MPLRELFAQHPELLAEEAQVVLVALQADGHGGHDVRLAMEGSPEALGYALGASVEHDMNPTVTAAFLDGMLRGLKAASSAVTTVELTAIVRESP